jgi:multiple sugar transport system permease protein
MGVNEVKKSLVKAILPHIALIVLSVFFVFPFLWLLSTSLKTTEEMFKYPLEIIPRSFRWLNYAEAVQEIPFLQYAMNTIFVTAMSIVGQLFGATLVAYSISLVDWKGKNIIFGVIMSTMMIPMQVTMVPVYIIFSRLHLVGTFWPLIIPTFTGAPIYIFLLRQFFLSLPPSLLAAAKIDGASETRTFLQIVLPLCRPAITSVAVVTFLYTWSDFLSPLIYLNKQSMFTLTLGLQGFLGQHTVEWNKLMAASALFTVPIVIIFFFAQKQFIQGITLTGIKG